MAIYKNLCPAEHKFQWGEADINEKNKITACYKNCYGGKTEKGKRDWEQGTAILNRIFGKSL